MQKLALCIGINNYPGNQYDLSGCVNDAKDFGSILIKHGFTVSYLLDMAATRTAIMSSVKDMIAKAVKGDSLFITNSSHGTQIPDLDGDEQDGMDEATCCVSDDRQDIAVICDDEWWGMLRSKQPGVQIIMVSDSCHSGTVARKIGAPILAGPEKEAKRKFIPYAALSSRALIREVPKDRKAPRLIEDTTVPAGSPKVPWPVLLLSGCQDDEYSYDAVIYGRPNGAMTAYALQCLKDLPAGATYNDWFIKLRSKLPSRNYPQTPRMIGSYLKQKIFS